MQAIILAGGLGTRLRTLVADVPKPMAEVAGRPFLEYLLLQLRQQGMHDILLCTGHLSDSIQQHFADGSTLGLTIHYSVEKAAMGTAGALRLAKPMMIGERQLVLNGDTFLDLSFAELIAEHEAAAARVTMALVRVPDSQRYGRVTTGVGSDIASFAEKGEGSGSGLINGGVYVMEQDVLDLIPPGRPVSLEREILPSLVSHGLHGLPVAGSFVDIGVPEDYLRLRDDPELVRRLTA